MKYFISKAKYNGDVVYLNCDKVGYKVNPKNNIPYDGIKVNEMVIIKPEFIQKIIKRKIKARLEFYLKFIIDDLDDSSDDTRMALGDLQRYKKVIKEKYSIYLDKKYLALLNGKIDILERNLKSRIVTSTLNQINEIEEKETRRSR